MNRRRFVTAAGLALATPLASKAVFAQNASSLTVGDYELAWTAPWEAATQQGETTADNVPFGAVAAESGVFQFYLYPQDYAADANAIVDQIAPNLTQLSQDTAATTMEVDRWEEDGRVSSLNLLTADDQETLILFRVLPDATTGEYVGTMGMFQPANTETFLNDLAAGVTVNGEQIWTDVTVDTILSHLPDGQGTAVAASPTRESRVSGDATAPATSGEGDTNPAELAGHQLELASDWAVNEESSAASTSAQADAITLVSDPYAAWIYAVPTSVASADGVYDTVSQAMFANGATDVSEYDVWNYQGSTMGVYSFKTPSGDEMSAFGWQRAPQTSDEDSVVAYVVAPGSDVPAAIDAAQAGVTIDGAPLFDGVDSGIVKNHMK